MQKKIVIDSDSILYRAAHIVCCKDDGLAEAEALADENEDEIALDTVAESPFLPNMIRVFNSMVKEIVEDVVDDAVTEEYELELDEFDNPVVELVITVKGSSDRCADLADNFRYQIMADVADENVKGYKANRAGMPVPDGLIDIYNYVFDLENSVCKSGIEADDYVVYMGRLGHVVAALDKDVLGSLAYALNFNKREWVAKNPLAIKQFPYLQTIMGDTSDGLRGVYRVGAKGAEKALDGLTGDYEMWVAVVKQYLLKDQTKEEAIATMRCVLMNQWTPENGLVLWEPPTKEIPND